jgi:hypothetical protein
MSGTSGRSQSRQKSFTSSFRNRNAARGGRSFEERMNIWRCWNMVPPQRCASQVEFRNCCRVHTASPPMAQLQNRRNCGRPSPAITAVQDRMSSFCRAGWQPARRLAIGALSSFCKTGKCISASLRLRQHCAAGRAGSQCVLAALGHDIETADGGNRCAVHDAVADGDYLSEADTHQPDFVL